MADSDATDTGVLVDVHIGTTIYDAEGTELGVVRGLDDAGFYVRTPEGGDHLRLDDTRDVFGTAYVMWRCWVCGEMGRLETEDLPAACPACDAPREELYYWAED